MSRVNAKRYGWFLLALFLGITLAACEKDHQSGPITYLLPWPGQDGEYRMQEVELHTIRYADRLEGAAAKIYLKSGIKDGDFQGEVARPRLIKKSKRRYVAADYESAMAIAVYAHYERFMMWDKELGIDSDLSWPRKVGIEMNMRTKTGDREHNNARYVAKWDVTLVAPTSVDGLPMALNGGVLAHEHFHAHFHARAIRYLQENWSAGSDLSGNEIRDTNVYLIRSWNEGLADFWGYLYTRDPRFMVKTFVREYHVRQLDEGQSGLPDATEFKGRIDGKVKGDCVKPTCQIYRVGTRVARILKQVLESGVASQETQGEDMEASLARQLMGSLPLLAQRISQHKGDQVIDPNWVFESLFPAENPMPAWACKPLENNLQKASWARFSSRCGEREESP
ncbi:MAG: hypothetical protein H6624_19375 [Bdellovibrionaceae bacterium]|nr:hypothetical protein [Bdellovibrionales bacterium]MCB9086511.1 hypothetical protein [Pseudobdellovibrionaceae bacterium]